MLDIQRLPLTQNKSLKAWNAADELMLQHYEINDSQNTIIINDRFGFLTLNLEGQNIQTYISAKSQFEAIKLNATNNQINLDFNKFVHFPSQSKNIDVALINCPKSLDLLDFYLFTVCHSSTDDVKIHIGFMTKYFSQNMLVICSKYFEDITQSKALKKARVITLKSKRKEFSANNFIEEFKNPIFNKTIRQYKGSFSSHKIDIATLFLLENFSDHLTNKKILDIGSGNGIITAVIHQDYPNNEFHLLDDSLMAHLSGKLNLDEKNVFHHWNYHLDDFEDNYFDLIITNPPFHFEHEIDLSIPLDLVTKGIMKLKIGGKITIVGNNHINYAVLLQPLVSQLTIKASNNKFTIYEAIK